MEIIESIDSFSTRRSFHSSSTVTLSLYGSEEEGLLTALTKAYCCDNMGQVMMAPPPVESPWEVIVSGIHLPKVHPHAPPLERQRVNTRKVLDVIGG